MYAVLAVGVHDINHKQVVAKNLYPALGLLAISVLVLHLPEDAALLAVCVATWGNGPSVNNRRGFFNDITFAGHDRHFNPLLFITYCYISTQRQRVGDLAPVCAPCADAGVL